MELLVNTKSLPCAGRKILAGQIVAFRTWDAPGGGGSIERESAEASNFRELLTMSEEALQQMLEHRDFMALVIELCAPDS